MFDLTELITLLETGTPYTIKRAKVKQPALAEEQNMPIVYVGFSTLDSSAPTTPHAMERYAENGEDLVQGFDIQIICLEEDLVATWRTVYKAWIGKNPNPLEEAFSGFTYQQGGVLGIDNGRICWLDKVSIGFPVVNVF